VIAVAVALLALGATSASPAKPAPLRAAPGFSLAALDHAGQSISLASYAGRPLVINFFASWCGPCQKETPLIAQFYRTAHGRVTVLGVDVNDSATSALKFHPHRGGAVSTGVRPAPDDHDADLRRGRACLRRSS